MVDCGVFMVLCEVIERSSSAARRIWMRSFPTHRANARSEENKHGRRDVRDRRTNMFPNTHSRGYYHEKVDVSRSKHIISEITLQTSNEHIHTYSHTHKHTASACVGHFSEQTNNKHCLKFKVSCDFIIFLPTSLTSKVI